MENEFKKRLTKVKISILCYFIYEVRNLAANKSENKENFLLLRNCDSSFINIGCRIILGICNKILYAKTI